MRALLLTAFGLALAAGPLAAQAGQVDVREDIASEGDKVTLGDIFYDAGAVADVVVAAAQPGQTLVLDAARVQVAAAQYGLDWRNPAGLRRLVVYPGAARSPRSPATRVEAAAARRQPQAQTLTYLHNLNTGDIVTAADLGWSRDADAALDSPRDPDAVIGMAARHALREGASVSMRDVSAPQVIKKDDVIAVVYRLGGVSLTLQAKAMNDAVAGAPVTVQNPSSKKVIQAVAVAPGQAVVGPEADQFKGAQRGASAIVAFR